MFYGLVIIAIYLFPWALAAFGLYVVYSVIAGMGE